MLLALYVWVHGVPLDLAPRRPDRIEFECRARKWGGWHPDGLPGDGRNVNA